MSETTAEDPYDIKIKGALGSEGELGLDKKPASEAHEDHVKKIPDGLGSHNDPSVFDLPSVPTTVSDKDPVSLDRTPL